MTGADVFMFTPGPLREPDPDTEGCRCPSPDGIWKLAIDAGQLILIHSVCGKGLPEYDMVETVFMEDTDVLLSVGSDEACRCRDSCDCDISIVLTIPR